MEAALRFWAPLKGSGGDGSGGPFAVSAAVRCAHLRVSSIAPVAFSDICHAWFMCGSIVRGGNGQRTWHMPPLGQLWTTARTKPRATVGHALVRRVFAGAAQEFAATCMHRHWNDV